MPVVSLASIQAEADREYGDLKFAMTDEVDEAGEPVDFVALRNAIRLSKDQRADLRAQQERYRELTADPDDVIEQRKKVNAAQNRLETAQGKEKTTDRVLAQLESRLAEETDKLREIEAEHEGDDEGGERKSAELRSTIFDMVRAVAVSRSEADRLLETTKTENQPEGDMPYLMGIFTAYMNHGEVGEASPSES